MEQNGKYRWIDGSEDQGPVVESDELKLTKPLLNKSCALISWTAATNLEFIPRSCLLISESDITGTVTAGVICANGW